MKVTHGSRVIHKAGVVVVHAVDVGPDLDFIRLDSGTNQRSGIITATPLQVINFAISVAADKALRDVDSCIGLLFQLFIQLFADISRIRLCILIGAHEL